MEIYLIRHTTPDISKGVCYGQLDIGVTDSFEKEAKKIREQVPLSEIDMIYSSPLLRCFTLAKTFQKSIATDLRLKELNFGNWENQAWDHIPQKELTPWMEDFVNVAVPNGESYIQLQQRIINFYREIKSQTLHKKIVIITHAGPMRALLAYIRKIDLKDSFDIKIGYGEVIKLPII